jgi:hypothetical protein
MLAAPLVMEESAINRIRMRMKIAVIAAAYLKARREDPANDDRVLEGSPVFYGDRITGGRSLGRTLS